MARLIGKTLTESNLSLKNDIEVLEIRRDKEQLSSLLPEIVLAESDLLIVKGNIKNIMRVRDVEGAMSKAWRSAQESSSATRTSSRPMSCWPSA